ncbi:MAG TPA: SMC family ATPase [Aldersonia sp.]
MHRLEVTAFGPFAATETVDFDALGADGLFLLHGQTGAGKSSVLDAVAFALFGVLPGARRGTKRIRSDHAEPPVVPRVTLDATIAGRRFRLARSPEFSRPKRSGQGVRTVHASATLTWQDGSGVHLSRMPDIRAEVHRLLGMTADQFFQVVLLPQGEFATFLRASNEDRERLLEQLFDAARFGTAEAWLAERRRTSAAALEERRVHVDRLLAQIRVVVGSDEPAASCADDEAGWAREHLATARTAAEQARTDLERRAAAARAAAAALDAARILDERRRQWQTARQHLAALAETADERAELAADLARARHAEQVLPAVEAAAGAAEDAAQAATAVDECAATLAQLDPAADVTDLEGAARTWSAEYGRLDELAGAEAEADRLDVELDRTRDERADVAAGLANARQERAGIPALLADTEQALQVARDAAARIPALEERVARARRAAQAAAELVTLRGDLADACAAFEVARARHNDARARVLDLRERRLAGMAAELAAQLRPDEPCPVCGARDHPAPRQPIDGSITPAAERNAARAEQHAVQECDGAAEEVTRLDREVAARAVLEVDGDAAELLAETIDHLAAARAVAAGTDTHAEQLRAARASAERLDGRIADLARAVAARDERLAATERRCADLRSRIASALGGTVTVRERRAHCAAVIDAVAAVREARAVARTDTATATANARTAEHALRGAGFESADAARAAQWPARRRERVAAQLAAGDETRARAEAVAATPELAEAGASEPVNLDALAARHEEATAAHRTASTANATGSGRLTQLEQLTALLCTELDTVTSRAARHAELATVADLVAGRGANNRRMSLRSYVLAARLEEVAEAASARLRRMSGGRYEFVHTDEAGTHGRRGGLGLDIRDDYTGAIRPAQTLSGGETFLASLALALGLADTVAAESGGRLLDTIFVDEGFDTLDDEALDSVLGVLDELRAGGRVVGLVSHVDELRQRIPSRLHVIRGRAGSRLQARIAG